MVDVKPATWMTDLYQYIDKRKLSELFIPGSHDSAMTFDALSVINEGFVPLEAIPTTPWGPDADANLRKYGDLIRPLVRNWAVTQMLPLEDQLIAGIRYFDLRIAQVDGQFKFTHTLLSRLDIFTMLKPVKDFLQSQSGEVIILHCQHFHGMQPSDYDTLLAVFQALFSSMLVPNSMVKNDTLQTYISTGKRVVLVWGDNTVQYLKDSTLVCDQGMYLNNPWNPSRMQNKEDLAQFLLDTQNARPTPDPNLSVVQGIFDYSDFSSRPWDFLVHKSLLNYEKEVNPYLLNNVFPNLGNKRGFIYMTDNVVYPDNQGIKDVIALNGSTIGSVDSITFQKDF